MRAGYGDGYLVVLPPAIPARTPAINNKAAEARTEAVPVNRLVLEPPPQWRLRMRSDEVAL